MNIFHYQMVLLMARESRLGRRLRGWKIRVQQNRQYHQNLHFQLDLRQRLVLDWLLDRRFLDYRQYHHHRYQADYQSRQHLLYQHLLL